MYLEDSALERTLLNEKEANIDKKKSIENQIIIKRFEINHIGNLLSDQSSV